MEMKISVAGTPKGGAEFVPSAGISLCLCLSLYVLTSQLGEASAGFYTVCGWGCSLTHQHIWITLCISAPCV